MTDKLEAHPDHVVVFAIVRAPSSAVASVTSVVRSVAILTITHEAGKSVRFDIDQRIFSYGHTSAVIIEGLAATIPRGATVMSGIDDVPVRPSDLDLLAQARSDLLVISMNCCSDDIAQVAAAYSLPLARPNASVEMRVHRLPVEVQCLWLMYLWAYCDDSEREWLIAGWLAWRALRLARPFIPDLDERR
ncbi:MAG: hypothetical protein VX512_12235 [Pseudomonadota bacterium]|nr:hypothetical protein [Pseudomonadota bacterium]